MDDLDDEMLLVLKHFLWNALEHDCSTGTSSYESRSNHKYSQWKERISNDYNHTSCYQLHPRILRGRQRLLYQGIRHGVSLNSCVKIVANPLQ